MKANERHPVLGPLVKDLAGAHEVLSGTAMRLLSWFHQGKMALVPLAANRFLEMMSAVAVSWLLLDGARIALSAIQNLPAGAEGDRERAFYEGKRHAAIYFARTVLPEVKLSAEILGREDSSAIDIHAEAFATI